jgi:hypothetical protein
MHSELKSYINNLLIKVSRFIKESKEEAEKINKNVVQKILAKNKKITNYQNVEIPQ